MRKRADSPEYGRCVIIDQTRFGQRYRSGEQSAWKLSVRKGPEMDGVGEAGKDVLPAASAIIDLVPTEKPILKSLTQLVSNCGGHLSEMCSAVGPVRP